MRNLSRDLFLLAERLAKLVELGKVSEIHNYLAILTSNFLTSNDYYLLTIIIFYDNVLLVPKTSLDGLTKIRPHSVEWRRRKWKTHMKASNKPEWLKSICFDYTGRQCYHPPDFYPDPRGHREYTPIVYDFDERTTVICYMLTLKEKMPIQHPETRFTFRTLAKDGIIYRTLEKLDLHENWASSGEKRICLRIKYQGTVQHPEKAMASLVSKLKKTTEEIQNKLS